MCHPGHSEGSASLLFAPRSSALLYYLFFLFLSFLFFFPSIHRPFCAIEYPHPHPVFVILFFRASTPTMPSRSPEVSGLHLDPQTRCLHYHGPTDIIAIKMRCCLAYYACKDCHDALANHSIEPWLPSEWHTQAILCGSCRIELTISAYLQSNSVCPNCQSAFNPRCRNHYHFYFAALR
jgi:uncharacterized CHY-type Zn-finger protein